MRSSCSNKVQRRLSAVADGARRRRGTFGGRERVYPVTIGPGKPSGPVPWVKTHPLPIVWSRRPPCTSAPPGWPGQQASPAGSCVGGSLTASSTRSLASPWAVAAAARKQLRHPWDRHAAAQSPGHAPSAGSPAQE
jgi:hypothetical protein